MSARGADEVRRSGAVRLLAILLALLAVAAAVFALTRGEREPTETERLLARTVAGLVALQGPDGAFDPEPDAPDLPEVLKTGPHALAAAALARAEALELPVDVPGLRLARDHALDVLKARQQPGGGFGGLPPSAGNRWPGVNAISGGVLALSLGGRVGDADALRGALAALERSAAYELRDGWTRALAALALDAARAQGALALLDQDPTGLLRVGEPDLEPGCRDELLAEAVVRRVRGLPGPFPDLVVAACIEKEPVWLGERSDVQAWWLQAWLAVRSPDGPAWTRPYRQAVEEGLTLPPVARLGGGWYADEITRTACAVLGLAEGLAPLGPGPHPGRIPGEPE